MARHIECQRFGNFQHRADLPDEFVQFALLLTVGAVAVAACEHGQYIRRIAVVAVDDALQGRFDAQRERLAGLLALIRQYAVADVAFLQIDHVHERHAAGVEAEHEEVARQRIFGMQFRQVGVADPPERFARQRALAGRHLPDMPAAERVAVG